MKTRHTWKPGSSGAFGVFNSDTFLSIHLTDPAVGHCRSRAFQEIHGAALLPQCACRCLRVRCYQLCQFPQPTSMDWGMQAACSGHRGSQDPSGQQVWSPRLHSSGYRGGAAVRRHPFHASVRDVCKELKPSEGWNSGPRKQWPRGSHFYDGGPQVAISEASGVKPARRGTRGDCQSEQQWGQQSRWDQELGLQQLLRGTWVAPWRRVGINWTAFNEYCFWLTSHNVTTTLITFKAFASECQNEVLSRLNDPEIS